MDQTKKEILIEMGWIDENANINDLYDSAMVGVTADTYMPIYDAKKLDEIQLPEGETIDVGDGIVMTFGDNIDNILKENEGAIIFEAPSYHDAIIGSTDDGRIVYDYDKMVECLCNEDGMESDEAMDFIGYNTFRAMPYFQPSPVVYMPIDDYID